MKYSEMFIKKERADGTKFMVFEGSEYIQDFIHDIHRDYFFDCWPNDWIYSIIAEAFDALEKDSIENCNFDADPYYNDLINWLKEPYAQEYVNEVLEECGGINLTDIISDAQSNAIKNIYYAVDEFITEHEDYDEDEELTEDIE